MNKMGVCMNDLKSAFIKLAFACNVIQFGTFQLKSGRKSPYFFNAGLFYQAHALRDLGRYYAQTILQHHIPFDHVFGPAYKGIPIATATVIALAEAGVETTVSFDRKEIKHHGDGGQLIGAPLSGRTVVLDDVISKGLAFRHAKSVVEAAGGVVSALCIALDRCEQGEHAVSTKSEIESLGVPVYAIVTIYDVITELKRANRENDAQAIEAYLAVFGV